MHVFKSPLDLRVVLFEEEHKSFLGVLKFIVDDIGENPQLFELLDLGVGVGDASIDHFLGLGPAIMVAVSGYRVLSLLRISSMLGGLMNT
jgi:hypothetical protein